MNASAMRARFGRPRAPGAVMVLAAVVLVAVLIGGCGGGSDVNASTLGQSIEQTVHSYVLGFPDQFQGDGTSVACSPIIAQNAIGQSGLGQSTCQITVSKPQDQDPTVEVGQATVQGTRWTFFQNPNDGLMVFPGLESQHSFSGEIGVTPPAKIAPPPS